MSILLQPERKDPCKSKRRRKGLKWRRNNWREIQTWVTQVCLSECWPWMRQKKKHLTACGHVSGAAHSWAPLMETPLYVHSFPFFCVSPLQVKGGMQRNLFKRGQQQKKREEEQPQQCVWVPELILKWIIEPMSENHRPFRVDLSARQR